MRLVRSLMRDWRISIPTVALLWFGFVVVTWWLGEPGQRWLLNPISWAWLLVVTPLAWAALWLSKSHRSKPMGYVGKFRRPDGRVIHVARMTSGKLWAASDTQPPEEIGYVDGRDLMRWEKLATTPDG